MAYLPKVSCTSCTATWGISSPTWGIFEDVDIARVARKKLSDFPKKEGNASWRKVDNGKFQ